MTYKEFLHGAIGLVTGAAVVVGIIAVNKPQPQPDQLLLAEATGALCAGHEFANEELQTGVCREFCDLLFMNSAQSDRCQYGYRVRTAELIAVANVMQGTPL